MGFDNDTNLELPKELLGTSDAKEDGLPSPESTKDSNLIVLKPTPVDSSEQQATLHINAMMESMPDRSRTNTLPLSRATQLYSQEAQRRVQDDHPLGRRPTASNNNSNNEKKKKENCNVF